MSLDFASKAGTLTKLQGVLKSARIAPLYVFTVADWRENDAACLKSLKHSLSTDTFIVRSSCGREDTESSSNAGAFLSIPNVETAGLRSAIVKVIASYGESQPTDEVLIQPMLKQVVRSGVAFTHDPNTCAPYRVINWSEGEDTAMVTGGIGGQIWQQAALSPVPAPISIAPIVVLLEELLVLFCNSPLDCEFAVTRECGDDVLWLLQARPLILTETSESEAVQAARLDIIQGKVARGMQPHPFLVGKSTVYGVMPDWNPAEIVGTRPKPLALSLYRELITDSIWAYQRHNYGYRNLRSFPLMPNFFGLPYIDVRLSFNSFVPTDLDEGMAGRLVDHYLTSLLAKPALHDKVEFEIVYSCYSLDLPQRLKKLLAFGFSNQECEEIAQSLRKLTNRIIHPKDGLWCSDAAKIDILNSRRDQLLASSVDSLERVYWLLEDAKRYGTLPFAGLARVGFIAVQMLQSLVALGIFSQLDYDTFVSSISTVSRRMTRDRATLDMTTFLARYGHLRPGTYEIQSPRYDEKPDFYFDWNSDTSVSQPEKPFSATPTQMRAIAKLLEEHGIEQDPVGLLDFIKLGIELREESKFHFSRNLSDVLSLITEFGKQYGFSSEDLAYCNIMDLKELHTSASDVRSVIMRSIEFGKACHNETLRTFLPPLITKPEDVWAFELPYTEPNYITQKQITAAVVSCETRERLEGSIVCIPNADPGFDWLFSFPIAGLITAWGGANSHMAIRAGELGLPAVIGAGQLNFKRWSCAHRLRLDCAGRRVEVLD